MHIIRCHDALYNLVSYISFGALIFPGVLPSSGFQPAFFLSLTHLIAMTLLHKEQCLTPNAVAGELGGAMEMEKSLV